MTVDDFQGNNNNNNYCHEAALVKRLEIMRAVLDVLRASAIPGKTGYQQQPQLQPRPHVQPRWSQCERTGFEALRRRQLQRLQTDERHGTSQEQRQQREEEEEQRKPALTLFLELIAGLEAEDSEPASLKHWCREAIRNQLRRPTPRCGCDRGGRGGGVVREDGGERSKGIAGGNGEDDKLDENRHQNCYCKGGILEDRDFSLLPLPPSLRDYLRFKIETT